MKKISVLFFLFVTASLLLNSCNKDNIIQSEFEVLSLELGTQNDLLESNESEISDQVDAGFTETTSRTFPTRTWSAPKGTYPNVLTIDYGTAGVTGNNGHVRKGKIIVALTASMSNINAMRTVSHENFYIDDVRIVGIVILINKGLDANQNPYFERKVIDRKLSFPSGKTMSWNADQVITQTEGSSTPLNKLDNVFTIDGSSNGVNREGNSFVAETLQPLVYKVSCAWLVKGILALTLKSKTVSINYGDGACNNAATITLPDGTSKEINIRRWW